MKLRFIIPMIGAVLLGYFVGKYFFTDSKTQDAFQEVGDVYLLQQGVYSTKEVMEENVASLDDYLYQEEDGKFYVYLGITGKEENATKLKEMFEGKGISIYVKPSIISNASFLTQLMQYDVLLNSCETEEAIDNVRKAILESYRENVMVS